MKTQHSTETQHTPGPWIAHVANPELRTHVDHVNTVHGLHVCDVASYGASLEQRAANARLIAASPDLLAALECCAKEFDSLAPYLSGVYGTWQSTAERARAAIAKARGAA